MSYLALAVLLISAVCSGQTAQTAQTAQPPATAAELKFLRFLLLNVGSLDHSPDAIASYENSLVKQFGLSAQESTAIHSAGQTLNTALAQLRQSTQALVAGKTVLSPTDIATLQSLNAQREQTIESLANQILNSVSAITAARLRTPGHILANAVKSN
jgi:hypothetical protein